MVGTQENGLTFVSGYKKLKPDIVTIDMFIPHLKGLDCLELLKEIDPKVDSIMVKSVFTENEALECIREGAKRYILKPFNEETIKEALENLKLLN